MDDVFAILKDVGKEERHYIDVEGKIRERGSLRLVNGLALLRLIYEKKASGILTLKNRSKIKRVCFKDGEPVEFRTNLCRELIGSHLVVEGVLSRAQCDEALAAFKERNSRDLRFGSFLVQKGLLTQEILERTLRLQRETHVINLIGWNDGEFWFEKKDGVVCDEMGEPVVQKIVDMIASLFDPRVDVASLAVLAGVCESCRNVVRPPSEGEIENYPLWKALYAIRVKQTSGYLQIDRKGRLITILFENGLAKIVQVLKDSRSVLLGANFKGYEREFVMLLLSTLAFTSGSFRFAERFFAENDEEALERDTKEKKGYLSDLNISEVEESRVMVSPTFVKRIEDLQKSHIRKVSPKNLLFSSATEGKKVVANMERLEKHFLQNCEEPEKE